MSVKNGKVYGSKASAYQVLVRPRKDVWNSDGSVLLETRPALTAEFAFHGGEFTFENTLTGATDVGADIRGHFFDSAQQAIEKGWTQEEHDVVVLMLDQLCERTPEYVWEVSLSKAVAPWATYDEMHHKQIVPTAEATGFVVEALAYEQQNKNRAEIVERLTELVNASQEQDVAEDALTAA